MAVHTTEFPTTGGSEEFSGKSVTDGGAGIADANLGQGGHRTWLIVVFGWLIEFVQWATSRLMGAHVGHSTTSLAISVATKTLTVEADLGFAIGQTGVLANDASPAARKMIGTITAYDSETGSLTLEVESVVGAGTYAAWTLTATGPRGATGATGAAGADGAGLVQVSATDGTPAALADKIESASGGGLTFTTSGASGADQTLLVAGGVIGKHTLSFEGDALIPRTTNGCEPWSKETTTNDIMLTGSAFDPATKEGGQLRPRMNAGWDEGSTSFSVECMCEAGAGTATTAVFGMRVAHVGDGDAWDASFGTQVKVTISLGANDTRYTSSESAAVTGAGGADAMVTPVFELERIVADDNCTADVIVTNIHIYKTDAVGVDG